MDSTDQKETLRPAFPDRDEPKISFGLPFPEACAKHVESTFKASRVYIIASKSLSKNTNALVSLQAALGDKVVGTRIGMKSHTLWSEVVEIVQDARNARADFLVTLGAGSLSDGAKIVALALANDVSTFDDLGALSSSGSKKPSINPPTIPIISIPTSLSGGEYTNHAGGTHDKTHQKHSFGDPIKGPRLVILDAALSTTTPPSVWLSTGIRAVDHCVECICSLKGTPETDETAEKGLKKLVPGLLRCKHDGQNVEARHECQLGVVDASRSMGLVPMGGSHGIGHQLGPLGVGHGETSCIMLPSVCKFNVKVNGDRQKKVTDILWGDKEIAKVLQNLKVDRQAELGDVLTAIIGELGMPRSLKDVGVGKDKIDGLAENSLKDRWCKTNPIPLEEKGQIMEILNMASGYS
ncbi:MAG: hypothetical protein M1812_007758 [Candelaria pacifica]|nr:MAG: hypothetical protein M1812_007758 [Candelaria pacifica]